MSRFQFNQSFDPQDFLRHYWQKKPVLLPALIPDLVDPISPEELAGLACEELVESRLVSELVADKWELEHGPFTESRLQGLPDSNWTLLVQGVDQWSEEIARLRQLFDFVPSWRVEDVMVSFATTDAGVGPHFDYYDVILLQGQGQRRWQVGGHCATDGLLLPDTELGILASFSATEEFILNPGDALYLPPQFAHRGISNGESLCYSIGFRAPSMAEMLEGFSDSLIAEADPAERFTDPGLELPTRIGEIRSKELTHSYQTLMESFSGFIKFSLWFGCYVTRPKYPELIQPLAEDLQFAQVTQLIDGGSELRPNPSSRFAFIESSNDARVILFVDGGSHRLSPAAAEAASLLCSLTVLNREIFTNLSELEGMPELLLALVNQGSLLLHKA